MNLSSKGAEFIRHHEGFVPRYYLDPVGVPTIGIGFTWRSDAFREWWQENRSGSFGPGATMTRAEADEALRFLVSREYGAAVNRHYGRRKVPQHVFDGTVSPVFNLGAGSLAWNWAKASKRGDYAEAANLLRTTGTTAQGKELRGLVTRRREEAELIAHADYTIGADTTPADPMADGVLRRGERGEPVMSLQEHLASTGMYDGDLDGIFGYGTEAAVMDFQRANGLAVDGIAGPKTLAAVEAVSHPPAQPQKPPAPPEWPRDNENTLWGALSALFAALFNRK